MARPRADHTGLVGVDDSLRSIPKVQLGQDPAHMGLHRLLREHQGRGDLPVGLTPRHQPEYVGHRGWLGVYLDVDGVDWDQLEEIVDDAYRQIAPKTLIAQLDRSGPQ